MARKTRHRRWGEIFLIGSILLSICHGPNDVVATVGDQTITVRDLRREYHPIPRVAQGGPPFLDRKALLSRIIRRKLLVLAARNDGFQVVSSSAEPQSGDSGWNLFPLLPTH